MNGEMEDIKHLGETAYRVISRSEFVPTDPPMLSIIMPCEPHNSTSATGAIYSALYNQSHRPSPKSIETVVVLDGQPTKEQVAEWSAVLKKYAANWILACTVLPTHRTGDAQRDVGQEIATGRYFMFLDDDDQVCHWAMGDLVNALNNATSFGSVDGPPYLLFLMERAGHVFGTKTSGWQRGDVGGAQFIVRAGLARRCTWDTAPDHKDPKPGDPHYATDWFYIQQLVEQCSQVEGQNLPLYVPRIMLRVGIYKMLRRERPW